MIISQQAPGHMTTGLGVQAGVSQTGVLVAGRAVDADLDQRYTANYDLQNRRTARSLSRF